MSQAAYTQADILSQLDACAAKYTFPMLDNGYVYLADVRLSAYRTEQLWCMIIEVLGSDFRSGGVFNCLYRFGNCFSEGSGLANDCILTVMDDPGNDMLFDEDRWDLLDETGTLRIRDKQVPYDVTPEALVRHGIEEEKMDGEAASMTELVRSLVPEHRALLLATEEELMQRVQVEVPLILRLAEWNHPNLAAGELPSTSETFQMIAEVLVSGDPALYKPALPPNTHWKNWLESGTL